MANSKNIAGLIGPSLIAITISETLNIHIWAGNTAAGIHFNGAVLFVAGLAIIRAHNLWIRAWPVVVTLTGWVLMLLGLYRMFAPEFYLQGVQNSKNTSDVIVGTMFVLAVGIFLTFKAYGHAD